MLFYYIDVHKMMFRQKGAHHILAFYFIYISVIGKDDPRRLVGRDQRVVVFASGDGH